MKIKILNLKQVLRGTGTYLALEAILARKDGILDLTKLGKHLYRLPKTRLSSVYDRDIELKHYLDKEAPNHSITDNTLMAVTTCNELYIAVETSLQAMSMNTSTEKSGLEGLILHIGFGDNPTIRCFSEQTILEVSEKQGATPAEYANIRGLLIFREIKENL